MSWARARGTALLAGLVVGVGAAVGGCSGTGAVAQGAGGEDPADLLHRAGDRLVAAGASRARTRLEMASGGTRVTIRGEGVYDYVSRRGRLRVLLPEDPSGRETRRPITELLAPGALFMKNRGAGVPEDKWVRVDTTTLPDGNLVTGGATDPLAAAEVLRGAWGVTYVGRDRVGGEPVRHFRGTADLARAAGAALAEHREPLAAAAEGFASEQVPFDAYVDDEGLVRKIRHRFSYTNGAAGGTVAVASTTLLFDFGAPVTVRLPEAGDIYAGRIAEESTRED
ncbi:hypothetical protein AAH978_14535 [Streptomyces sp. ZYX-F-203]